MSDPIESFQRLVSIMDELREQCPWDKKQTIHTLRQLTIEETYELADAITENDWQGLKEELGDLMLHLLFYSRIAKEQSQFTLNDVLEGIAAKMIERHPHIYGDVKVQDEEEVKRNWEKIKLRKEDKTVLGGVPKALPATVKAMRLQEKAKQVGFEWEKREDVWEKVKEEMDELQVEVARDNTAGIEDEFGDVMFSLINYARFLRIDAENALELTNKKFISRFNAMEALATARGQRLHDLTLGEMDALWNEIKRENKTT
jgi:MazG family protein